MPRTYIDELEAPDDGGGFPTYETIVFADDVPVPLEDYTGSDDMTDEQAREISLGGFQLHRASQAGVLMQMPEAVLSGTAADKQAWNDANIDC